MRFAVCVAAVGLVMATGAQAWPDFIDKLKQVAVMVTSMLGYGTVVVSASDTSPKLFDAIKEDAMAITDALVNKTEVALDAVVTDKFALVAEGVSIFDGKVAAADAFKYDKIGKVTGKYFCQPGFCTVPPQRRRTLLQQSSVCVECGPDAYCPGGSQTLDEPKRAACPTPAVGSNVVTFTTGNVTTASSRDQCLAECNDRSVLIATANECTACTTPPNCATPGAACFGSSSQRTCTTCAAGFALNATANTCIAPTCTSAVPTCTYLYLRWTITKRRGPSANSVQASEFELLYQGQPVVNQYASVIETNPGGSNPGNELPAMVHDGNVNTKWLDFKFAAVDTATTGSSIIILRFPRLMTLDGYAWYTANDAIERDPVSWTLEGSNDGSVYTTLSTQTDLAVTNTRKEKVGPFTVVCCVNV